MVARVCLVNAAFAIAADIPLQAQIPAVAVAVLYRCRLAATGRY